MNRTNILTVINEAMSQQRREQNKQIARLFRYGTAEKICHAPIFARLGVMVDDQYYPDVELRCPNGLEITVNTLHHYIIYYKEISYDGRAIRRAGDTIGGSQLDKVDYVNLMTGYFTHSARDSQYARSEQDNLSNLADLDPLRAYYAERRALKVRLGKAWRGHHATQAEIDMIKQHAEHRSGLSFNPDGKQRVVRKK